MNQADAGRSPLSSPSRSPSGTERRPSVKRSNRYWRRRSRTGSWSSPTIVSSDGTIGDLLPPSQLETSAFAISRPGRDFSIHENFRAAFHHSRGTYFRWHGDDDWLRALVRRARRGGSRRRPQAPSSARRVQQYYRDADMQLPVSDPTHVLSAEWTRPKRATRVRTLLHLLQQRRPRDRLRLTPLARREVAARTSLQPQIRDGDFVYSCEMALLGPFVHVPEVLAHRRFDASSGPGSRGTSCNASSRSSASARATKGLPTLVAPSDWCVARRVRRTRARARPSTPRTSGQRTAIRVGCCADRRHDVTAAVTGVRRRSRERLPDDAHAPRAPASPLRPARARRARADKDRRGLAADGLEAELLEKVARENGSVDEEPFLDRLAVGVVAGERLHGDGSAVAGLPDRRGEKRLLHPFGAVALEVRARDEDCVVRNRPGREIGRAGEQVRRPILKRSEQSAACRRGRSSPLTPVLLGAIDPAILRCRLGSARLPPHAIATHRRCRPEGSAGYARDPDTHRRAQPTARRHRRSHRPRRFRVSPSARRTWRRAACTAAPTT